MHIVYCHTNLHNGKRYVGITPKVPAPGSSPEKLMETRWAGHCYDADNGSDLVFHKAIRKYGPNSFEHMVLEVCETLEQVLAREVHWIGELKSTIDDHGYNMTRGGEGNLMTDGVKERHRRATSAGTRAAFRQPEVRENYRKAMEIVNADPNTQKKRSTSQRIAQNRPDVRAKKSASAIVVWSDQNYRIEQSLKHRGSSNGRAKLTELDVVNLIQTWNAEQPSDVGQFYRHHAQLLGVTPDLITHIIKGRLWKHVTPRPLNGSVSHRGKKSTDTYSHEVVTATIT